SEWFEVTQDRVNLFADATDDHQWIHVDTERAAAESPFGGPIGHGFLTLSLFIPMWSQVLTVTDVKMGVNYGLNKVRFPAPVPVGSRIRLTATLVDVEEFRGGLQLVARGGIARAGPEIEEMAALVGSAPDISAPVVTCPEWTIADLARHTGLVHRWATKIV